jgi:hypothetical protein
MSSRPFIRGGGFGIAVRTGDSQWIVPAAALVVCQYVAALVLSATIGVSVGPPQLGYMPIGLVISFVGGSVIAIPAIWRFWREGEPRPIARLIREADLNAVAVYLIGFQLVALQMGALTWLKVMLPAVVPYWADPALASLDRAIIGTDAWRLIPESLMRPFDILYLTWAPLETLSLFLILCLRPSRIKARAMIAYFLMFGVMGVFGQYLLSSVGPVFYDRLLGGEHFAGLLARIDTHAEVMKISSNMLWESYSSHSRMMANGISAMPSMHVASTVWIALALASLWPKLRVLVWAYWLIIFIGSFALGWHYFLDGVVGTLGALGCWALAGGFLMRYDREPQTCTLAPVG